MQFGIPLLPINSDIETKAVLKQLASSHRYLALLNGKCATIPNEMSIKISKLSYAQSDDDFYVNSI